MYSQLEQDFDHSVDMVINTLRRTSDPRRLTGSVPVVGDAAKDPEKFLTRLLAAAEANGFGHIGLAMLGSDRIAFNGSKD